MAVESLYITTSWDDGHPLDLKLAEMLAKYGLAGTFYVPIRPPQESLDAGEIRQLSRSFEIGGHTVTHCDLRAVTYSVSRDEIGHCKDALEQITSLSCRSFCFPMGRFRRGHIAQVRDAGFTLARTVELMSLGSPQSQCGVALMPTTILTAPGGVSTFFKNAAKRGRPGNFLRWARFRGDCWVATLDSALAWTSERGGIVHLWGHSWEIEQNDDWHNLEQAFSLLQQYKTRACFASNGELLNLLNRPPAIPSTGGDVENLVSPSATGSCDY